MSPEKQRIAIATACGWHVGNHIIAGAFALLCGDKVVQTEWYNSTRLPTLEDLAHKLPDFLSDLNAMHEAEKILDVTNGGPASGDCLRYAYSRELYKLVPEWVQPFRATAEQRAEAFLRTLNLWTD